VTIVKIAAIGFTFSYLIALRYLDGEVARDFVQFNAALLIGSIVVRLFGDLYYISGEVDSEGGRARFRVTPFDLVLPLATGLAIIGLGRSVAGVPPLVTGVVVAAHCYSVIGARYLQRTGAQRSAFAFISIPYFQLGGPTAVLFQAYTYDALMLWALIHFALVAGLILWRRVFDIELGWRLNLWTRLQQSAGVLSGTIVNQGGMFLIAVSAPAALVAKLALFYRLSSFWTFQTQTYNMDRQISIIDARRTLRYIPLMRNYYRYIIDSRIITAGIVISELAILSYFIYEGNAILTMLLITAYFLVNVAVGPIIFFSVMVLGRGAAVVGIVTAVAVAAYAVVWLGLLSGVLVLFLGYMLLSLFLIGLIYHEGRLFALVEEAAAQAH
jgi:hypothetical protein